MLRPRRLGRSSANFRRSSLQVNLSYVTNVEGNSAELDNISGQEAELNKSCNRLKEAILNKTREIFDKQNDFCLRTATILEKPCSSGSSGVQSTESNEIQSQNDREVNEINFQNCLHTKENKKKILKRCASPIVASSHLNPIMSLSKQNSVDQTLEEPIKCSTFINENCNTPKRRKSNRKSKMCSETCRGSLQSPYRLRPLIKNVKSCFIPLNRIDRLKNGMEASKDLNMVSMDLTKVQGKILAYESNPVQEVKRMISDEYLEFIQPNSSLEVETSINPVSSESKASGYPAVANKNSTINVPSSSISLDVQEENLNDVVPGTPIAVSRSVLMKSLAKLNSTSPNIKLTDKSTNIQTVNQNFSSEKTRLKDTIVLNGTLSKRTLIIDDSSTDENISDDDLSHEDDHNTDASKSNTASRSRKLFSQHNTSDLLNVTPVAIVPPSPIIQPILSSNKKIRFRRNLAGKLVGTSATMMSSPMLINGNSSNEENLSNDEMSDDSDADESRSKKKVRKLFTQHNTSDLASLSPRVLEAKDTPKINKSSPKTTKKRIRKNLAGKIIGSQPIKTLIVNNTAKKLWNNTDEPSMKKLQKLNSNLEKRKTKKKRKVLSKKIIVKKQVAADLEFTNIMKETGAGTQDTANENERSSMDDFMVNKRIATSGRNRCTKKIVIVTTGLTNGDKDFVKKAVKKISGAKVETSVTRRTTHVLTSGVRTINLLRGIIRGCWLVNLRWIKKSIEAQKWLSAETFEIHQFSKAVKENRRDRAIFGRSYVPELFATSGLIYIDQKSNPPKEVLKELVKTAGGQIIEDPLKAKIVVGPNDVKEIWILDSITMGETQPIHQYQRLQDTSN